MCFYTDDYEWTAEVVEETEGPGPATKCMECGAAIPEGAWRHHVHMQEHEDEQCEWCDKGVTEDGPCADCSGTGISQDNQTYEYDRCEECDKFLRAVEASEIEEGCSIHEARPGLGFMTEEIQQLRDGRGNESAGRYIRKALDMFPELRTSGYITKIARRVC